MPKNITKKTTDLIQAANEVLSAEHPMTIRQLFYRLVSILNLNNCRADYQKLSRVMTQARESGEIDPEWIVDRSKPEIIPNVWEDVRGYLKTVSRGYKRNYWRDQPHYTEVWIEKDSLTGSIDETIEELGITLRTHRGYGSTTKKLEIASLFDSIDKPMTIFYIGDFDPSGVDIERDLLQKVKRYMKSDRRIILKRLGILREDIEQFNLPPLRVKERDPRAKGFCQAYGTDVVEADALPPTELRSRIKEAVTSLIYYDRWNRNVSVEEAEFESIRSFVENYKVRQVSI